MGSLQPEQKRIVIEVMHEYLAAPANPDGGKPVELQADLDCNRDLPQRIVASLAPAIEAIVRRAFVFSDSGHTAREMVALLSTKLHQGSVSERRFASVAIGLHTQYRNAATHEYERFSCGFEEARYFVAGLRVLMALCEEIAHKK